MRKKVEEPVKGGKISQTADEARQPFALRLYVKQIGYLPPPSDRKEDEACDGSY